MRRPQRLPRHPSLLLGILCLLAVLSSGTASAANVTRICMVLGPGYLSVDGASSARGAYMVGRKTAAALAVNDPVPVATFDSAEIAAAGHDTPLKGFAMTFVSLLLSGFRMRSPQLRVYAGDEEVLGATQQGDCDLAVPIASDPSVQSTDCSCCLNNNSYTMKQATADGNICCLDRTPGYLDSGLTLIMTAQSAAMDHSIVLLVLGNTNLINTIILMLLCLVVVGHLVWLFERKSNPDQFDPWYFDGIDDGVWLAASTVTT